MKKQRPSGRKPIKDKICLGVYITTDKHERLMEIADREGKRVFYSPLQKRAELLEDLKACRNEYKIRFLKAKTA